LATAGGSSYDDYSPAHRFGADAYNNITAHPDRSFDEAEPELSLDWGNARGKSSLEWECAKHASRDAWQRVSSAAERAIPADSDGDGH
jgi:hypothetical protein